MTHVSGVEAQFSYIIPLRQTAVKRFEKGERDGGHLVIDAPLASHVMSQSMLRTLQAADMRAFALLRFMRNMKRQSNSTNISISSLHQRTPCTCPFYLRICAEYVSGEETQLPPGWPVPNPRLILV